MPFATGPSDNFNCNWPTRTHLKYWLTIHVLSKSRLFMIYSLSGNLGNVVTLRTSQSVEIKITFIATKTEIAMRTGRRYLEHLRHFTGHESIAGSSLE